MPSVLQPVTAELIAPGQQFELQNLTIGANSYRTWKNAPGSLREIFDRTEIFGDATYLVYQDERISYSQLRQEVASLSQAFIDLGIVKGDRIAIAMRNLPEWVTAFWATVAIGAIVVPLNAWWTSAELAYGVDDCDAKVLILDQERLERIAGELTRRTAVGERVVAVVRCQDDVLLRHAARLRQSKVKVLDFKSLIIPNRQRLPNIDIDPDDPATIFYTSGTTANPKGVLGTHRNICTNMMSMFFIAARNTRAYPSNRDQTGEKTANSYLLSVPLFHATGCHAILIPNTFSGAKIVMMRRWNPEQALELIERESITSFGGVPTMVFQVLSSPDLAYRNTTSVKTIGYGGAPAPPELLRRIVKHFPLSRPSNGYGLTETSAVATMNAGEDYLSKPDSAGPALPIVDIRCVRQDGTDAEPYETGELWIKGPNVVAGYWNNSDATQAVFTNGWFHSGDLAYLDDERYVYIVDRAKDILIRGGENISSIEIENVIFEHQAVADVAVIGIADLVFGEEVAAVVRLHPQTWLDPEELRKHVASRLAGFKVPKYVFFYDAELPRNPAGKILKRQLRLEMTTKLTQS